MRQIPAWLVGLVGACLILAATAINSLVAPNLDAKLATLETRSAKLDKEASNLWASHTRADDIQRAAEEQRTICSQLSEEPLAACLVTVSHRYRAAILNMLAASGRDDVEHSKHEERANSLLQKVASGDNESLAEVISWIDELRLESRDAINSRRVSIDQLPRIIHPMICGKPVF